VGGVNDGEGWVRGKGGKGRGGGEEGEEVLVSWFFFFFFFLFFSCFFFFFFFFFFTVSPSFSRPCQDGALNQVSSYGPVP